MCPDFHKGRIDFVKTPGLWNYNCVLYIRGPSQFRSVSPESLGAMFELTCCSKSDGRRRCGIFDSFFCAGRKKMCS